MKTHQQLARRFNGQEDITFLDRHLLKDNGLAALYVSTTGYVQLAGAIWCETPLARTVRFNHKGFGRGVTVEIDNRDVVTPSFPCSSFLLIDEDGERYTRGIVFRVADLPTGPWGFWAFLLVPLVVALIELLRRAL